MSQYQTGCFFLQQLLNESKTDTDQPDPPSGKGSKFNNELLQRLLLDEGDEEEGSVPDPTSDTTDMEVGSSKRSEGKGAELASAPTGRDTNNSIELDVAIGFTSTQQVVSGI